MIELALMVIDRLVGLVRAREASKRQLHDDFLVPMVADFERVHQNYVDTFTGYRSTLLAAPDFDALLARIAMDVNSTSHLRSKLQSLTPLRRDPVFGSPVGAAFARSALATKRSLLDTRVSHPDQ